MPSKRLLLVAVLAVTSAFLSSVSPLSAASKAKPKLLHIFGKCKRDAANPWAGLIFDAVGNLYGTSIRGGVYGWGTVFQLTRGPNSKWTSKVLHSFNNYARPIGRLVFDAKGNLYGTTSQGGTHGLGTVFELTPSASGRWTETMLHSFGGPDGSQPEGALVFDAAGNLYGTTVMGGAYGWGTVFRMTRGTTGKWAEKVLHSFNTNGDGYYPYAGLIFDASGNLYGTTYYGGEYCRNWGCGTAFELSPGPKCKWTEKVLHSFGNDNDGSYLQGGLIFDAAGNLYGTAETGGAYGMGTVFELTPGEKGTWTETVLYSFNGQDGYLPTAGLIFDGFGNLYGTTAAGGNYGGKCAGDCGVVFELVAVGNGQWTEKVLHAFNLKDGAAPTGDLIFDGAGNLYSTTVSGGNTDSCNDLGCGVAFEITP